MLELIFHRRMLEYPCLTPDPNLANAVFLPYYAGLDGLKYLFGPEVNSSFRHGLDLFEYITNVDNPAIWNKNLGHDHFLVMARPAWDFSQPLSNNPPIFGSSFLELPEFFNITALTLEARAYSWQEQAIPYPTSFHPPNLAFYESWVNRVKKSRRSTLMLFAGGGGISANPNVRRSIRLECENVTSMSTNGTGNLGEEAVRVAPAGGELRGVLSVHTKEDVVFKGVKIMDVLMSIPRAEIRRKREKVLEMLPRIMYRKHGSSLGLRSKKDAFDIAIEGTLQRIKSRTEEIAAQHYALE
ncbi:UNVERIFIED_CONTAM: putative xyloglucan galactosyltransferase GT19 [Sesamum calycinum]|uniref:Xyloglucan galactosyltransferase GT19 n=1 Tax=Sesamum calycinum TaxID=2727403 RepID=A0AAW2LZ38_9LAMI